MKNKLLTIKDLHKVYYSKNAEIEAIKNITFDLYEGEFISIVGPSGCGKSTFLNILTKMDNLTSGEIIFLTLISNLDICSKVTPFYLGKLFLKMPF